MGVILPKFEFLRLSLSVPTLGALAIDGERREPETTRREFLELIFKNKIEFFYQGKLFTYAPSPNDIQGPDKFSGFVGKPVEELVSEGPEKLFALTRSKNWKASFLTIDVRPDQQVIAFERRNDVGSPHRIVEALIDHFVRQLQQTSWHVDLEYMSSPKDFWKAVDEYKGHITEVSFEFHPANGLKGFETFKKFDKLAKQQANAEKSTYALKNESGAVIPKGEFVEEAVEYASEGGGGTKLKDGRKTLFSSKSAKKVTDVPETLMPRQGEPSKILGLIAYLFGKTDD